MSDETIGSGDILDKKDFGVPLLVGIENPDPFFTEDQLVLTHQLDLRPDAEEDAIILHEVIGETPKGIVLIQNNYFHYFTDFIGPVYAFINNCIHLNINDVNIIGVDLDAENSIAESFFPFLEHCLEQFSDRINISYTTIAENIFNVGFGEPFIKINKSRIIDQRDIGTSIDFIYESAKSFSEISEEAVPSKKVFISRKNDLAKDATDSRTLYEEECEQFFSSIGFEIVNGESFESIKDEISYFRDASVLVGMTGSGLTNSMFMNPGQTVVEIVCPIKFTDEPKYEIHNFYKTISMLKKHKYVAVQNINSSQEDLLEQLAAVANML
jgi:hypothetical protein